MTFSPQKQKFIDSATDLFGAGSILTNKQVEDASYSAGIPKAGWFKKQFKVGYNQVQTAWRNCSYYNHKYSDRKYCEYEFDCN